MKDSLTDRPGLSEGLGAAGDPRSRGLRLLGRGADNVKLASLRAVCVDVALILTRGGGGDVGNFTW